MEAADLVDLLSFDDDVPQTAPQSAVSGSDSAAGQLDSSSRSMRDAPGAATSSGTGLGNGWPTANAVQQAVSPAGTDLLPFDTSDSESFGEWNDFQGAMDGKSPGSAAQQPEGSQHLSLLDL
jgi:hypothetical protein